MTKRKLQKILKNAGIQTSTMELRVFIPTENTANLYAGWRRSRWMEDEDENGTHMTVY